MNTLKSDNAHLNEKISNIRDLENQYLIIIDN